MMLGYYQAKLKKADFINKKQEKNNLFYSI